MSSPTQTFLQEIIFYELGLVTGISHIPSLHLNLLFRFVTGVKTLPLQLIRKQDSIMRKRKRRVKYTYALCVWLLSWKNCCFDESGRMVWKHVLAVISLYSKCNCMLVFITRFLLSLKKHEQHLHVLEKQKSSLESLLTNQEYVILLCKYCK